MFGGLRSIQLACRSATSSLTRGRPRQLTQDNMLSLGIVFALVAAAAAEVPPPPHSSSGATEYGRHGPGQFAFNPWSGQQQYGNPQPGPHFEKADKALESVVKETHQLFEDLESYKTILRINDEKLARLHILKAQKIDELNVQQDGLIKMALDEINALACEVDAAAASAEASLAMALQTANITSDQTEDAQELAELNAEQDATIASINITDVQHQLLDTLQDVIYDLEVTLNNASEEATVLEHFVRSRRCEYGSVQFSLKKHEGTVKLPVHFVTEFDLLPSVIVSGAGFVVHIEEQAYDRGYDNDSFESLGVNATATDITTSGFKLTATSSSSGRVENKEAVARWMACQNLNVRLE